MLITLANRLAVRTNRRKHWGFTITLQNIPIVSMFNKTLYIEL